MDWALVENSSSQHPLIQLILKGDYEQVIKSEFSKEFLQEFKTTDAVGGLCVGVAFLYLFLQDSWTGPCSEYTFPTSLTNKEILAELQCDCEDVYPLIPKPIHFLMAKRILVDLNLQTESSDWWKMRTAFIHQRLLDDVSGTLQSIIHSCYEQMVVPDSLKGRLECEFGLIQSFYKQDALAFDLFKKSQNLSGLSWQLTGALGKRTKFQTFDVSQLMISASDNSMETEDSVQLPKTLDLNDDVLLEKIEYSNQEKQGNLSPLSQCLLLAFCLNVRNTNPSHGLTTEEMSPYVSRVLQNPNNWMVHTMALLLKSRLEAHKSRTVERACLQLQALVDQFGLHDSPVEERMLYIFNLLIPPKWELERELGERFVSLGVIRSALEIFERLEMWEDVVSCHQMLEQNKKADAVVSKLLQEKETPKLWTLLGDIRGDISFYEKAWQVSNGRYPRAMRSLGAHYYKSQDWKKCIECYQLALAINPLFDRSWFIMGCAAMQIQDYEIAETAFQRVTSIDPENGEAWNNLASVFIKKKNLKGAFSALKESLRHNHESSNIWENYLLVTIDVGEYQEAIRAAHKMFDLRIDSKLKEKAVDLEILNILSTIQDKQKQVGELLSKIASRISSFDIYLLCAKNYEAQEQMMNALDYYQRAHRLVLHDPELPNNTSIFHKLIQATQILLDAFQRLGPLEEMHRMGEMQMVCKDWKYQSKMLIKSVLSKTRASFQDTIEYEQLQTLSKDMSL